MTPAGAGPATVTTTSPIWIDTPLASGDRHPVLCANVVHAAELRAGSGVDKATTRHARNLSGSATTPLGWASSRTFRSGCVWRTTRDSS